MYFPTRRILLQDGGDLKYAPVVKSFRLLGSRFFSEFQSRKLAIKTKDYDIQVFETGDDEAPDYMETRHSMLRSTNQSRTWTLSSWKSH